MRWGKYAPVIFLFFSLIIPAIDGNGSYCIAAKVDTMSAKTQLVWAQHDGEDYEIYYSRHNGESWEGPLKITDNEYSDLMPAIGAGADGTAWIVWSAYLNNKTLLFYSYFDGASFSEPSQIPTPFSENTSPAVYVGNNGEPWVVWSGFDGTDDDIFYTCFTGGGWKIPARINIDDTKPDILPAFAIDSEGMIRIIWQGYDGQTYRYYASRWSGARWDNEIDITSTLSVASETLQSIPDLPDYVKEKDFASIAIQTDGKFSSIRVNDLKTTSEKNRRPVSTINSIDALDITLLTIGDSITVGFPYYTGEGDGARWGGYQPYLEGHLKGASQTPKVLNYGVSGENTTGGLGRLDGILSAHSGAKMLLILEGTNDVHYFSRETTYSNWRAMVDKTLARGITPILASLTPDTRPIMDVVKQINTTYNAEIRKIVVEKNITLCELYNPLRSAWDNAYTDDGLHPNREGYQAIAKIWFDTIKAPIVETLPAISVGETDAVVAGNVNPRYFPTNYYFEYGYNTTYGGKTPTMNAGSGNVKISVSAGLSNLSDNAVYHYRLVVVNDYGIYAGNDLSFQTVETPSKTCFIATAAFGSPLESHVLTLKAFRDRYLSTNRIGKSFVRFYYQNSPRAAEYIRQHDGLRMIVKAGLYPIAGFCYFTIHNPLSVMAAFGILFGFVIAGIMMMWHRNKKSKMPV